MPNYILPTLEEINRKPPVGTEFADPVRASFALIALQNALRAEGAEDYHGVYLVLLPGFPKRLAKNLHKTGGFSGSPLFLEIYPLGDRIPRPLHLPPGSRVVIASVAIVSTFVVDRATAILARQDVQVELVIGLYDLRMRDVQPQHDLRSRPSVRCAVRKQTHADGPEPVRPLLEVHDPDGLDHQNEPRFAAAELSPEEFLSLLSHSGARIALGHFESRADRHLSAIVDFNAFLANSPEVRTVVGRIVAAWLRRIGKELPAAIYYPVDPFGYAKAFAELVKDALRPAPHVRLVALRRSSRDLNLLFQADSDSPNSQPAILVDWGAVTSRTLRRAVGVVSDNGHEQMLVLLLTSQLDRFELDDLLRIRSVAAARSDNREQPSLFGDEPDPITEAGTTEIVGTVLTELSLPLASNKSCWSCASLRELSELADTAPSRGLRRHIMKKRAHYELIPAAPDNVSRDSVPDYFDLGLDRKQLADIVLIRSTLAAAASNTLLAHKLKGEFLSGSLSEEWLRAFLCLVTVEADWLKQLPTARPDVRAVVADTCLRIAKSDDESVYWRQLAVMCLRSSSKASFLTHFMDLFQATRDSRFRWELALGLYTLLIRPYHRNVAVQGEIARAAKAAGNLVNAGDEDGGGLSDTFDVIARTADSMGNAAAVHDPLTAWGNLISDYGLVFSRHPRVASAALEVLDAVGGPAVRASLRRGIPPKDEAEWAKVRAAWKICADFLARKVLPNTSALTEALSGFVSIESHMFDADEFELLLVSHTEALAEMSQLDLAFEGFAAEPVSFTEHALSEVALAFGRWYNCYLRPPNLTSDVQGKLDTAAHLYRAIQRSPSLLGDAWRRAVNRCLRSGIPIEVLSEPNDWPAVFCDSEVLADAVTQVLENAYARKHRARGFKGNPTVIAVVRRTVGNVSLEIRNTGTAETEVVGRGLSKFDGLLRLFGGRLVGRPMTDGEHTYSATVSVRSWVN